MWILVESRLIVLQDPDCPVSREQSLVLADVLIARQRPVAREQVPSGLDIFGRPEWACRLEHDYRATVAIAGSDKLDNIAYRGVVPAEIRGAPIVD